VISCDGYEENLVADSFKCAAEKFCQSVHARRGPTKFQEVTVVRLLDSQTRVYNVAGQVLWTTEEIR
jgi:hypothetical protein